MTKIIQRIKDILFPGDRHQRELDLMVWYMMRDINEKSARMQIIIDHLQEQLEAQKERIVYD